MLGVDIELVDDMVGSSAAALPDAENLPVGLGDDHQRRFDGRSGCLRTLVVGVPCLAVRRDDDVTMWSVSLDQRDG
jgi:hypothetical protein